MLLERIERIIKEFSKRGITLAIAESCTGGFISHMITNISGASKVFERGIICYSNQAKINLLKVNPKIIEKHGAVSELVALQMAKHIKEQSSVDIGIGITGIAGPTGGTKEKPVGLVYITTVKKFIFKSDRIGFKESALKKILELLERYIKNNKNNLISEKF